MKKLNTVIQLYHCTECHEDKPLQLMLQNKMHKDSNKGKCKQCHNKEGKWTEFLKRVDAKPEAYCYCDSCDEMFHKTKVVKHTFGKHCPCCNSVEIGSFA